MRLFHGFSLLELCIVLVLVGLLLLSGMSLLHFILRTQDDRRMAHQILLALHEARLSAIFRGVPISLCASNDEVHCLPTWQGELLVFIDSAQQGIVTRPDFLLHQYAFAMKQNILHWRSFPQMNFLHWLPTGTTAAENGTIWYCRALEKNPIFAVMISNHGRVRLQYPSTNREIIDAEGKPLTCS